MTVTEITSLPHFREILSKNSLVAVQAHAEWCGPCKAISPLFAKHAASPDLAPVFFARFDTDEVSDLAQELGIRSIPAFFFFKGGDKVASVNGANPGALKIKVEELAALAN